MVSAEWWRENVTKLIIVCYSQERSLTRISSDQAKVTITTAVISVGREGPSFAVTPARRPSTYRWIISDLLLVDVSFYLSATTLLSRTWIYLKETGSASDVLPPSLRARS